jgi:hypothetical protein
MDNSPLNVIEPMRASTFLSAAFLATNNKLVVRAYSLVPVSPY